MQRVQLLQTLLSDDMSLSEKMLLFAGDNVDHNIITIDGKGTFHGIGIILAPTPGKKKDYVIPRQNVTNLNISVKNKIPIIEHRFVKLQLLTECDRNTDILWELSPHFQQDTPGWQGSMHIIHQGLEHPGKSSIVYLPMIDLCSGDKTCILSTLDYVCNLTSKHNMPPIISFDQLLYWKAAEIIVDVPENSSLKTIFLILGCFHTFMNLLGAIETLMEVSGLRSILEVVYGGKTVQHMMTGKSVRRAFWGHLLIDRSLNYLVVSDLLQVDPHFKAGQSIAGSGGRNTLILDGKESHIGECCCVGCANVNYGYNWHKEGRTAYTVWNKLLMDKVSKNVKDCTRCH